MKRDVLQKPQGTAVAEVGFRSNHVSQIDGPTRCLSQLSPVLRVAFSLLEHPLLTTVPIEKEKWLNGACDFLTSYRNASYFLPLTARRGLSYHGLT
jgi:hypothetical protein